MNKLCYEQHEEDLPENDSSPKVNLLPDKRAICYLVNLPFQPGAFIRFN